MHEAYLCTSTLPRNMRIREISNLKFKSFEGHRRTVVLQHCCCGFSAGTDTVASCRDCCSALVRTCVHAVDQLTEAEDRRSGDAIPVSEVAANSRDEIVQSSATRCKLRRTRPGDEDATQAMLRCSSLPPLCPPCMMRVHYPR